MESSHITYDHEKSFERMKAVLNASDLNFTEVDEIPSREKLTFTNGFYVKCSALFADIRGSSSLPARYKRPILSRIYRSYVSELIAVMNGSLDCKEIVVAGDCVSGIFNGQYKSQINEVFDVAAKINSMVMVLNYRLKKRNIEPISVGIGMSNGRALMVKAGYSGSGISDVVWMGDVVNEACGLGNYGSASLMDYPVMVSSHFKENLNEHNQGLLMWNSNRNCYHCNVLNSIMNKWYEDNCK